MRGQDPLKNGFIRWAMAGGFLGLLLIPEIGHALNATPPSGVSKERQAEAIFQRSLRSDDLEENRAYLEEILTLAPDSPYGHFSKGWFHAQDDNYSEAILEYEHAVLLKPDFNEARHNLASAYFYVGEFQKAINQYRKVIEERPLWAEAHLNLGTALFLGDHLFSALSAYEDALRLDPHLSITHYYMALVLDRLERWEEAQRHFLDFLSSDTEKEYPEYHELAFERQGEIWVLLGHQST